jgi:hypothetical protein
MFSPIAHGIMPTTICYFAWGCFPYFSWKREPPRRCGSGTVANGNLGQQGRFEEDSEGSKKLWLEWFQPSPNERQGASEYTGLDR